MYVPRHFSMTDDECVDILGSVGAADLVTYHEGELSATYLPFLWEPTEDIHGRLIAHVQRNNEQWRHLGEAMVIAHLTDHYVSPAWLPSTYEHGEVVPTWDYVTVHAYGELVAHNDADWVRDAVERLTARYECGRWETAMVPGDYVERMLRAVVGIEIRVTRLVGKAKMAQNKPPTDVRALISHLRVSGDDVGAEYLEQVSLPRALAREKLLAELGGARRTRSPLR